MARQKGTFKKYRSMREKIKSLYVKWLDFRIMSHELRIINTEEKRLKLIIKKASLTSGDVTSGVLASARLRVSKYRQRELESVEEKVNYTYSKIKFNPITEFFKTLFSISRKYRFMTGFLGYLSLIISALQTGAVFVFSSAFAILTLPFTILTYILIAIPRRIRTVRMCEDFLNSGKSISLVIADGVKYEKIEEGYSKQLFDHVSEKGICLVITSDAGHGFSSVKKIKDDLYICTRRFASQLGKRMQDREFLFLIKI